MNLLNLTPGMYLVGDDQGTVDPFFVKLTFEQGLLTVIRGEEICDCVITRAVVEQGWWWRKMEANCLPQTWDQYPESIKEMGSGD